MKTYSELISIRDFRDRFRYVKADGIIGEATFGFERWLNQIFYRSPEWKNVRRKVILRDNGFDLAHEDYEIVGRIIVHHINPITKSDIVNRSEILLDPENLISTSFITHEAIHYGNEDLLFSEPITRTPNDTCPWRS